MSMTTVRDETGEIQDSVELNKKLEHTVSYQSICNILAVRERQPSLYAFLLRISDSRM